MKNRPLIERNWPWIASAALLLASLPPLNLGLLSWVALAPMLALLNSRDPKIAKRVGMGFGALIVAVDMFFVIVLLWRWTGNWLIGLIPWLVCIGIGAVIYWGLAALIQSCFVTRRWWLVPLVWAGFEAVRAYVPIIAFPWTSLAHGLWVFPAFGQHAALGTIYLVSAWCVIPSLLLCYWLWPKGLAPLDVGEDRHMPAGQTLFRWGLVFTGFLLASTLRYSQPPPGEMRVVTLGQPGIDLAYLRGRERMMAVYESTQEIAGMAMTQRSELLVLPEGMAPGGPLPPRNPLGPLPPVPILIGGSWQDAGKDYQSAFLWDGKTWQVSNKQRLVPYGEYIPFRNVIPTGLFQLGFRDFEPGTPKTLDWDGTKLGVAICFEGLFADQTQWHANNGAQLLATISMDEWYIQTPAWDQLWQTAIWRSIESGLPLVRAAGYGKTLAIDTRGNVIAQVPTRARAAQRVEIMVPERSDALPYRMAFVWLCWAAMLWAAVDLVLNRRRRQAPTMETI